jgi:arylsulfatase A-like enzyme
MTPRPDIVLLTIDCWRYDTASRMHSLRSAFDWGLEQGEAICQSAATPGVFPAILAGEYYTSAYTSSGALRSRTRTLPGVLNEVGYSTGAVVAHNPFLEKFRGEFDYFWNGGCGVDGYSRVPHYLRRQFHRQVQHRSSVPAPTVGRVASDWWTEADGPRFLLMHLMDPHEPYLPGLLRKLDVGPISARRALEQFHTDRLAMSDAQRTTVRRLYDACVDFVDRHVRAILSFVPDDAVVVVVGDHGEEFDHGAYRHARLYDECVRVPFFSRNLAGAADGCQVRQLDIPPTVATSVDAPLPDRWAGEPADGTHRDSFMLNHSPHRGESYLGLRSPRYKLIRTVDPDTGREVDTELYDLALDPRETQDLSNREEYAERLAAMSGELDTFVERRGVQSRIVRGTGSEKTIPAVEERLETLGYV